VRFALLLIGIVFAAGTAAVPVALQNTRGIEVRSAWMREAEAGQPSTSAYFILSNETATPIQLIGVSSPIAALAEIHVMEMAGMPAGGNHAGMMTMRQVADVMVPARGTIEFKPGGYHVMLFKIARDVRIGMRVPLTLRFSDGTTRTVEAAVGSRAAVSAPASVK
jgi:copper(I)-binding protein